MDYKNKFYKMLRRMSIYCVNQDCNSCIFYMGDICCIRDLFKELSCVDPWEYDDFYINWFNKWEDTYNELYE